MRALSLVAVLLTFAGCDTAVDSAAWYDAGTVATFDYQAGDVPLARANLEPIPSAERAVVMSFDEQSFCPGATCVQWFVAGQQQIASQEFSTSFPLQDATVRETETGLGIVYPARCSGSYVQGPQGSVTLTRVPRTPSDIYTLTPCRTFEEPRLALSSRGRETIVTPAGTFDTVVLDSGDSVEFWNWDVGLVRVDLLTGEGQLRGRFVRSAR